MISQAHPRPPANYGCMRSSTTAFPVVARKDGKRVKLYSLRGNSPAVLMKRASRP
jgi:hypothetical protein